MELHPIHDKLYVLLKKCFETDLDCMIIYFTCKEKGEVYP